MKFVASFIVSVGLAFSLSASAGIFVGGGGLGKTRLQFTSMLLEKTELPQLTLLPESAKEMMKETEIPDDLSFIPDDEFTDLLESTTIQLTDIDGNVLKSYTVRKLDGIPQGLIFVEVPTYVEDKK